MLNKHIYTLTWNVRGLHGLRLGGQLSSPARWHSHSRSLVRFPAGTNFLVGKKIPLAVLGARLGSLGHGPGFGGFFRGRVKPCCFLLMKNGWGPFTPPAAFFLLFSICGQGNNRIDAIVNKSVIS